MINAPWEIRLKEQVNRKFQNYKVIHVDLSSDMTDKEFPVAGDSLIVIRASSAAALASVKFNRNVNDELPVFEYAKHMLVFTSFFVSCDAQSGEWLDLLAGIDYEFDYDGGGGGTMGTGTSIINDKTISNTLFIDSDQDLIDSYAWLIASARDTAMGALSATHQRTLILLPGFYSVSEPIVMQSYTNISAMPGAVIQLANGSDCSIITATSKTNIGLYGLKLDQNRAGQTAGVTGSCILLTSTSNIIIKDIETINARTAGIYLNTCSYFNICNIKDSNSRTYGIYILTSTSGMVRNCYFSDVHYGLCITDSSHVNVSDIEITLHRKEGYAITKLSTGCSDIQNLNVHVHDSKSLHVDAHALVSGSITGQAAGTYSIFEVGDVVWLGDSNGSWATLECVVTAVAADGSSITFNAPPADDTLVTVDMAAGGGHVLASSDLIFDNCIFADNDWDGLMVEVGTGAPHRISFTNCIFRNNVTTRTHNGLVQPSNGLFLNSLKEVNVTNCVFSGNSGKGLYMAACENVNLSNSTGISNLQMGVYISSIKRFVMLSTSMLDNGTYGTSGCGIYITGTVTAGDARIMGCMLGNTAAGGAGHASYYGVQSVGAGMATGSVIINHSSYVQNISGGSYTNQSGSIVEDTVTTN
jgi:hypothetical protein